MIVFTARCDPLLFFLSQFASWCRWNDHCKKVMLWWLKYIAKRKRHWSKRCRQDNHRVHCSFKGADRVTVHKGALHWEGLGWHNPPCQWKRRIGRRHMGRRQPGSWSSQALESRECEEIIQVLFRYHAFQDYAVALVDVSWIHAPVERSIQYPVYPVGADLSLANSAMRWALEQHSGFVMQRTCEYLYARAPLSLTWCLRQKALNIAVQVLCDDSKISPRFSLFLSQLIFPDSFNECAWYLKC